MNQSRYEVKGKEHMIYVSKEELIAHGCRNCVWKLHNQCPHIDEFTPTNQFVEGGICEEFLNFILKLGEGSDSISAVWEKFNLYVLRLQALEDYKSYMEAGQELKLLETEDILDKEKLRQLEMKRDTYKVWWSRLNESVLKGLGRIVDREKKVASDVRPKLTVQQLNVLINDSAKDLAELEKKNLPLP